MSNTPIVFAICDNNCKWETMTKEQILAAIVQAVNEGTVGDIDAGFITKIQENNGQRNLGFWVGTTAQYNALSEKDSETMYILTDEDTDAQLDELGRAAEQSYKDIGELNEALQDVIEGRQAVGKSETANSAENSKFVCGQATKFEYKPGEQSQPVTITSGLGLYIVFLYDLNTPKHCFSAFVNVVAPATSWPYTYPYIIEAGEVNATVNAENEIVFESKYVSRQIVEVRKIG